MTNTFIAPGTARQPQRYVIGNGDTLEEAQASGEWIAADPESVRGPEP